METDTDTFELIPLDQLSQFELPNGMPCFIGDVDDIAKHVEAHGYTFYYVLCNEAYSETDANKNVKSKVRTTILKVVSNIISRSVTPVDPDEIGFTEITPSATYCLPRIPYHLVQKMEDFFRKVEEKYDTESIVLLTYDPNFLEGDNPGEGWGVLVPDQTNTAADCLYDHESIVEEKEEHVYVVGSAHSHPGMAAFASGTDHKDQADFPGIHITYGWRKNVNNNATEYHIELQTPGTVFYLTPEQVFGDFPKPEPSPEIDNWITKVTKKQPTPATTTGYGYSSYSNTSYNSTTGSKTNSVWANKPTTREIKLPDGFPSVEESTIVGEISSDDKNCPFCSGALIAADIDKRRCLMCHQYLMFDDEQLKDVVAGRQNKGLFSPDIDISKSIPKDIYIWKRISNNGDLEFYAKADAEVLSLGKG
jgi:hypothetical protein